MGSVKGQLSKKGFENNPQNINRDGGPPKTHWWSILLKEKAEAEDRMRKLKNKELMAQALIEKCKTGDIAALKEFGDRVQGKAEQKSMIAGTLSVSLTKLFDGAEGL